MARIPDEEIQRLKREVSLEQLARAQGVELRRHGADLIGLCPFHEDHDPSLVVTPQKNLWHCLGACRQGGSVIDWVMKADGVSFRHAVEVLREGHSVAAPTPARLKAPLAVEAGDRELLAQVVGYYHETLKESTEALEYLRKRGLESSEMIERFQLGFANRTLGYRLGSRGKGEGERIRKRLQELGVLRPSGHEHFNGSLVIPIFGTQGEVLGIYGRKVTPTPKLRKGTPLHLYLPGPHRGVFNFSALGASENVILCESLIDALTFWCAGFRNVTASYGTSGFTDEHLEAFEKCGVKEVRIAYDRDEAGERSAEMLARKLMERGMTCFRVQFPKGMDANEYALKVRPPEKSLGMLVGKAAWLGNGKPLEAVASAAASAEPDAVNVDAESPSLSSLAAIAAKEKTQSHEVVIECGERRYRVRGLEKNLSYDQLRVNVLVSKGESFHVDTFDLYSARHRLVFAKQAAVELQASEQTIKKDLGQLLLKLEELQDKQIREALEPKSQEVELSSEEKERALELLRDPHLLERILTDFAACGVVGEETNKLLAYLAACSRKLGDPLAVIVQSSSAAGKSSLMEAVLSFVPEEEQVKYSAMTGQSLYYMGETELKHKVLAIVEEQGVERASYALKLLQSEGELMIASTGKDASTGRLVTHEYRVEGPVMIFLTTTAIEIDEELLNRCLVLTVDEAREQTRAIHRLQREGQTLEGLLARRDRQELLKLHQDAQRLLKPLLVANPYARQLTFLDDRTRTRRDHVKYLTLIRTIALLHQYQRPIQTLRHAGEVVAYIEVVLDDIAIANRLAHQVFGRSLDELSPQSRRLLLILDESLREVCKREQIDRSDYRFTRRQVREWTGWTDFQVRTHLEKLVSLEYLLVHRGGRGQSFVYELVYDGQGKDGRPSLPGLIDVERLRELEYDGKNEPPSRGHRAPIEPPSSIDEIVAKAREDQDFLFPALENAQNAHQDAVKSRRSRTFPSLAAESR